MPKPSGIIQSPKVQLFFENCPSFVQKLLEKCNLIEYQSNLIISSSAKKNPRYGRELVTHALLLRDQYLYRAAQKAGIVHFTIQMGDGVVRPYPIKPMQTTNTTMTQSSGIITPANTPIIFNDLDLFHELYSSSLPSAAVQFDNDQGIASNRKIEEIGGVHPNDWLRAEHRKFWFKDELDRYKKNLLSNQEVKNYSYIALLHDGTKCRFTVDARLAVFRDRLIRIVKVEECIPIE